MNMVKWRKVVLLLVVLIISAPNINVKASTQQEMKDALPLRLDGFFTQYFDNSFEYVSKISINKDLFRNELKKNR